MKIRENARRRRKRRTKRRRRIRTLQRPLNRGRYAAR